VEKIILLKNKTKLRSSANLRNLYIIPDLASLEQKKNKQGFRQQLAELNKIEKKT